MIRLYIVILLISFICRVHHAKCQAGESQAGIKIAGRNIGNFKNADNTTLTAESEDELKSLLMSVKEESEKAVLKLNIQKIKIMASSPIILWQIEGEKEEAVTDCIYLSSKITANGDCSHEVKRCLFFGRKTMTNLDSVKDQRHHFAYKGPCSQSYGFSRGHVWMSESVHKEG